MATDWQTQDMIIDHLGIGVSDIRRSRDPADYRAPTIVSRIG